MGDPPHASDASWAALFPLLSVHFLGTLGYTLVMPFLVFVVLDLGGAPWTYGVIGALYSAFQLVGAPMLGRWSDRVGRRWILTLSQAGTFVAWAMFLVALLLPRESLGAAGGAEITIPLVIIAVARSLDGFTGGNMSVASAWVADLTQGAGAARQVAFGRMGMAGSLGFVLGPAFAGLLGATALGYVVPVAFAAILSLLCAVATLVLLRDPPSRCPDGPPHPPAVAHVVGQQTKRCDRPDPTPSAGLLRRPDIAGLLAGTFVMFLGFNFFYASFPVHASTALGWEPATLGLFFAMLAGFMIPAQGPILAALSRRLPPTAVFGIGMALLVCAFVAYFTDSTVGALIGAALFAVGNGLSWPTFQTRISEAAGDEQGAVQGAAASAGSLASIVGLIAGGWLYPLMGSGLFLLVAATFVLVLLGTPVWFAGRVRA